MRKAIKPLKAPTFFTTHSGFPSATINPEAWEWYWKEWQEKWRSSTHGGELKQAVYDHAAASAIELKAGSATRPFFEQPALVDNEGHPQEARRKAIWSSPIHGWARERASVRRSPRRFEQTYFSTFKNMFSGDGARHDEDGYYWITGRVDDVKRLRPASGYGGNRVALVAHRRSPKRRWWVSTRYQGRGDLRM